MLIPVIHVCIHGETRTIVSQPGRRTSIRGIWEGAGGRNMEMSAVPKSEDSTFLRSEYSDCPHSGPTGPVPDHGTSTHYITRSEEHQGKESAKSKLY